MNKKSLIWIITLFFIALQVNAADVTPPVVNTSFNITNPRINDIINFTGNITDEVGLLMANWTINMTGGTLFFNYSYGAGVTATEVSNTTQIIGGRGNVYNFTLYATDTNNNVNQNSTLITIADTSGYIQIGLNTSTIRINGVVNVSGNITEPDGNIAFGWATFNRSGEPLYNLTFALSGNNANLSTNFTINLSRGQVINFTVYYNDTYGTTIQNSTQLTILNTNPTQSNIVNTSGRHWNINQTFNVTPSTDADSDTLTYFWYYNLTNGNYVFTQNGTITSWKTNLTDGTYGILVNISDGVVNTSSAYFNFTIDSTLPVGINATNKTKDNANTFYTDTDANISVWLGDIHLSALNFSHNASGSWTNHSITITGNKTYEYLIGKGNFSEGKVIGWKYYAYDLAGNLLDPIYTFLITPTPITLVSGGGVPTGSQPLNVEAQPALLAGSCSEGNQYLDGACYPCSSGTLFKREDNTVVCVKCNEGFKYDEKGGCQLKKSNIKLNNKILENILEIIDSWSSKISSDNPFIGFVIIIIIIFGLSYWILLKDIKWFSNGKK